MPTVGSSPTPGAYKELQYGEEEVLNHRMSDLDKHDYYARYQVEIRQEDGTWAGGLIYACPLERFHLLLGQAGLKENQRLRRVNTKDADLAMITDHIITTVVP